MGKDAPRIEKACGKCGAIMYCTARREIYTTCRKELEKIGAQKRRLKNK